jgi:hypothetical protein
LSLTPEEWATHSTGQAQELGKRGRFAKVSILYPDNLRKYLFNHNILFSLIFLTFLLIVVKISDPSPL